MAKFRPAKQPDEVQAQPQSEMDALLLGRTRELVSSGPDQRNWRGIGIALLVIVAVCSLIVTAVILLSPGEKGPRVKKSRFNLEEVFNGSYIPRYFNGTWISDKEFIYRDPDGALVLYNAENSSKFIIMSNITFRQHDVQSYVLSPDRQYMLLINDIEKVFRYSFKAKYKIYNIRLDEVTLLKPSPTDDVIQYAEWGPRGNQLVYIYKNDMFYVPQVGATPTLIAAGGVEGVIFNGVPDWVYEEEVLSSNKAFWWAEDGSKLCYATFNDSEVDIMQYPWYGNYKDPNNIYPLIISLRYPKPGRKIPEVVLWVSDLSGTSAGTRQIQPPKEMQNREHYMTSVKWVDEDTLVVTWSRRIQNYSVISFCDEDKDWACEMSIEEVSGRRGWVDFLLPPIFSPDKNYYFTLLSMNDGTAGYFQHVAKVRVSNGRKEFVTNGAYDVLEILGYRQDTQTVYYIATLKNKPGERHLFSVSATAESSSDRTEVCHTCDLGDDCLFNAATFSPGSKFYILQCLGPGVPRFELRTLERNKLLLVLDTNDEVKERVDDRALPQVRTFQVPIEGGYNAMVRLFLPPGLRDDEITQYPMIVNTYGGPGSQLVTEKFGVHWGYYLASKRNFIYAWIDGRGSGNRGRKLMHEVFKRLGSVEVEDQIAVAGYLKTNLPFVDGEKIAIWGWSYGGYVTAMSLAIDTDVFTCGIAVAPVTSWRYYDAVYTERFMQLPLPSDNYIGYERSDVLKKAANFQGKKFMLIHGTADDNVHLQQSMMLAKALTDNDVVFRTQLYPDKNHALPGVTFHLYRSMEEFLDQCFSLEDGHDAGHHRAKSR